MEEPRPSIVIGVGKAGIEVLSSVAEAAKRQATRDSFRLIAVDSNEADLEAEAPNEATTIYLSHDNDFLEVDREACDYLTEEVEVHAEGAQRQRRVGRYKLDSRGKLDFTDIFLRLRNTIEQHIIERISELDPAPSVNIYLVNSLSGGTGSGTFPLLAASLSAIADEIKRQHNTVVYTFGVGIAPELISSPNSPIIDGPAIYYTNTHAALRDLQALMKRPSSEEPAAIKLRSVESTPDQASHGDQIELTEPPFDRYFLIGINDSRVAEPPRDLNEHHAVAIDNTIAEAVHAIAQYPALDSEFKAGPDIGTFNQAELSVPIDLLRRYCEANKQSDESEKLRQELHQGHYGPRLGHLPISNLDEINSQKLKEELTDLATFVSEEYVPKEDFEAAIETQVKDALIHGNHILSFEEVPAGEVVSELSRLWILHDEQFAASEYSEHLPDPAEFGATGHMGNPPRINDPYRISFVSFLARDSIEHLRIFKELNRMVEAGHLDEELGASQDYEISMAYPELHKTDANNS